MTAEKKHRLGELLAHIDLLLQKARVRTPGAWEWFGGLSTHAIRAVNTGLERVVGNDVDPHPSFPNHRSSVGNGGGVRRSEDADFMTACAGNAEAGWRVTRRQIQMLLKSPVTDHLTWDDELAECILQEWALTSNRRWQHEPGEPRCVCDFPQVWAAYPEECAGCMRLLPSTAPADISPSGEYYHLKEGDIRQDGDEYFDGRWRPLPEDLHGRPLFAGSFEHRRRLHTEGEQP